MGLLLSDPGVASDTEDSCALGGDSQASYSLLPHARCPLLVAKVGGPPGLGQRLCQDHLFPVTIWVLVMSTGRGFPGGLVGQDSTCSAGDTGDAGLIPGLGRSPGEGHGNPLQYSCLDNAMDRGAWRATVHGVARSRTQQKPSEHTHIDTWAWDASLDAHKLKQYPLPAGRTAPPAFGLEIPKERTF